MFPNKPKPKAASRLPKGATVKFNVRYRGGKKPFDTLSEATAFARGQRGEPDGWAEVSRVFEEVISPR